MCGVQPGPERLDYAPEPLSRRQLLAMAGTASLAVAVSACSPSAAPTATVSSSAPAGLPEAIGAGSGPAASAASTTPAPSGVTGTILCRDAWGARPARAGGRPQTLSRMTIHHTAEMLGANSNAPARLRQHQQYHQDSRGWIDIAYHISVDRNGNIYELRRPELVGDTATNYDPAGHFLVVCEGNFDEEAVTDQQLHGAALAFAWGAQTFGISTDTLAGHRDFAATACPGTNLYARVTSGELKHRTDALLTTGPVDLKTTCGPEAAAIVAAIEAGH
ncbi:N-acetylmuramoyl-L-alanine amidase [Mycobacteroides abscessus subsp. abscessus]|nr:N-acetylmuramoyl-L-alanine amidase [Mycobacteroides abscessus subsp. abscessus]